MTNGDVVVNGTTMDVTWKLIPGALWSDGKPITCADLEATWKWNVSPDNVGLAGGVVGWEDITAVEGGTGTDCVMKFGKIYEGYLGLVSILFPKHYIETVPVADAPTKLYPLTDLASGVYSGSFMPTKYAAGAQLEYVANPNWKTISGGKEPDFKNLIFKYYPDNPDGMIAGFAQGEYDLAMNLNHSDVPKLTGMDRVLTEDTFTYEQLSFNNKRLAEKTGSAEDAQTVKEAVGLAIDKTQIAGQVLGGTVEPIGTNNISPLAWYFKETPPSVYNPDEAKAKLDAAGWVPGTDGIREKAGKRLEFDFCTTTRPYRIESLTAFASQLAPIGIKVNPMPVGCRHLFGSWTGEGIQDDTACNLDPRQLRCRDVRLRLAARPARRLQRVHVPGHPGCRAAQRPEQHPRLRPRAGRRMERCQEQRGLLGRPRSHVQGPGPVQQPGARATRSSTGRTRTS